MNTLIIGGSFNDEGGKQSGYITKFTEEYKKYCPTFLVNGGTFESLVNVLDSKNNIYDAILWFADVPNDKEKLVHNIKQQFPKIILATSKRNLDRKYKSQDLIERALRNKSNITLEFVSVDNGFGVSIHDPLGNCFLYEETDIAKVAIETSKHMKRLGSFTRVGSISISDALSIPEENVFFEIIKKHAETFHSLINANTTRFLGNASFRCERGFPSFKKDNLIYVSQRNVDKRFIGKDGFVTVNNREDLVEYCGDKKPSVDTPIQIKLYNYYKNVSYMLHSHVYIKDAKITKHPVPCGAIEEFNEIIRLYPDKNTTDVAINLIGHGSLIMASTADFIENIDYIMRPSPEYIIGV